MAQGSGNSAAAAVSRDRSQAGIRHERRHVRAKKGRDGSTVTRCRPGKPTFGNPPDAWQGTLKRVAAWWGGRVLLRRAYTKPSVQRAGIGNRIALNLELPYPRGIVDIHIFAHACDTTHSYMS